MGGRPSALGAVALALALIPASGTAADGLDGAIRALSGPAATAAAAGDAPFGEDDADVSGWHIRRQVGGIEQLFLVNTLQVVRAQLPMPPGLGLATTTYDVLAGKVSPRDALSGYAEGEARGALFVGVQSAMLWLAAKAVAGSSGAAAVGAGASAAAVSATAPAAGAVVAPVSAGKIGLALSGPWADLVLYGAFGVATIAAAGASAAIGWGWQSYQEAALRSSEAEGLLRGAERVVGAGPLPAR